MGHVVLDPQRRLGLHLEVELEVADDVGRRRAGQVDIVGEAEDLHPLDGVQDIARSIDPDLPGDHQRDPSLQGDGGAGQLRLVDRASSLVVVAVGHVVELEHHAGAVHAAEVLGQIGGAPGEGGAAGPYLGTQGLGGACVGAGAGLAPDVEGNRSVGDVGRALAGAAAGEIEASVGQLYPGQAFVEIEGQRGAAEAERALGALEGILAVDPTAGHHAGQLYTALGGRAFTHQGVDDPRAGAAFGGQTPVPLARASEREPGVVATHGAKAQHVAEHPQLPVGGQPVLIDPQVEVVDLHRETQGADVER